MSVAFDIPFPSTGYVFSCNLDENFGGFCQDIDEAKQECQANAVGSLRWVEEELDVWEATDLVTSAIYEINALAY